MNTPTIAAGLCRVAAGSVPTSTPAAMTYVRTDRHGRSDTVVIEGSPDRLCRRALELVRLGYKPADSIEYVSAHGHEFDAIHASPPCQRYTTLRKGLWKDREHPDQVDQTRKLLIASRLPYAIENVPGAPLIDPITLCGTMFRLGTKNAELRRHRLFECAEFPLVLLPRCAHGSYGYKVPTVAKDGSPRYWPSTIEVYGNGGGSSRRDARQMFPHRDRCAAMGIDWMNGDELSQAIPPAYTEFIGRQLLNVLQEAA